MVNFGLLAAEIVSLVWGTPVNFNGFRILAALLHGTLVVGVSQTAAFQQRASPIFGRAAIRLVDVLFTLCFSTRTYSAPMMRRGSRQYDFWTD